MKRYIYILLCAVLFTSCAHQGKLHINGGRVFGTYYSFCYYADENYTDQFDSIFTVINHSLSAFDSASIISAVNAGSQPVKLDEHFTKVYNTALYVSDETGGAFDITVAPLVNLWGFGYNPQDSSTVKSQSDVDSVRAFVGYKKLTLKDGMLYKSDPRLCLDASAIAKGYACDVVAEFLKSKGVEDFKLDIGGEIICGGTDPNYYPWQIGIVSPIDDATQQQNDLELVVSLSDMAIATSGNYRQFYMMGDKKISHTIDPRTGYPVDPYVLSASVLAPECMVADAYATSFMVVGDTTAIKNIIKASKYDIEAYIIVDEGGKHKSCHYTK